MTKKFNIDETGQSIFVRLFKHAAESVIQVP